MNQSAPLPKPPRRRWAAVVLFALALLGGSAAWLVASESGLRIVCQVLERSSGGRLQIDDAGGRLLGDWRAASLRWRDQAQDFELTQVAVSWSPGELLRGRLALARVDAARLRIGVAPGDMPLPHSLQLPLSLSIAQLQLGQLAIGADGAALPVGKNIAAAFSGDADSYRLERLQARVGLLALAGKATLAAQPPFALAAEATLAGDAAGQNFSLELSGGGTLDRLQIDGAVSASGTAASGELQAQLAPLAAQPLVALNARLRGIDPAQLMAGAPQALLDLDAQLAPTGKAAFGGSLRVANRRSGALDRELLPIDALQALFAWRDDALDLSAIDVALAGGGSLKGRGRLAGAQLDLDLAAQRVDVRALHRRLPTTKFSGPLRATLGSDRQRVDVDWRDARYALRASARRSAQALAVDRLQLSSGDAALDVQGELALTGEARFTARGRLKKFDAARFLPAANLPHSVLNASFTVSGELHPALGIDLRFDLRDSRLGGRPLSGAGHVELAGSRLRQVDVDLDAAGNRLRAQGAFGRPSDSLQLSLAAPQLAALGWPALSGRG